MHDEGGRISDKLAVGLAILVGLSPLLGVVIWGLRTVHHRMTPENEPSRRLAQLAPWLCEIAAGQRSPRSLRDWLNDPARKDYLLIRSRTGTVLVVDWYGTPYFWRALDQRGQPLRDVQRRPIGGNLSLESLEVIAQLGRFPVARLSLISLGPDLIRNSPDDMKQTCVVPREADN